MKRDAANTKARRATFNSVIEICKGIGCDWCNEKITLTGFSDCFNADENRQRKYMYLCTYIGGQNYSACMVCQKYIVKSLMTRFQGVHIHVFTDIYCVMSHHLVSGVCIHVVWQICSKTSNNPVLEVCMYGLTEKYLKLHMTRLKGCAYMVCQKDIVKSHMTHLQGVHAFMFCKKYIVKSHITQFQGVHVYGLLEIYLKSHLTGFQGCAQLVCQRYMLSCHMTRFQWCA